MSRETDAILRYAKDSGVPYRATSIERRRGDGSCHEVAVTRCDAVDFAGPSWGRDTPELAAIFWAFDRVGHQLYELIHSGPGIPYNIKNGKRVARYAESGHHDHVHVAVLQGVLISWPDQPKPEPKPKPIEEEEMGILIRYDGKKGVFLDNGRVERGIAGANPKEVLRTIVTTGESKPVIYVVDKKTGNIVGVEPVEM